MLKGEETRARIVREAAAVFNRLGYAGASVSDLEAATGLRTGGLYRHFPGGKEELALAALRYAAGQHDARLRAAAHAPGPALTRLAAFLDVYRSFLTHPAVPGGCPVMNAAIEHDAGGSAALRREARQMMRRWQEYVSGIVRDGQRSGELRADADPDAVATLVVATLEGAIMLAGLHRDGQPLRSAADQLMAILDMQLRP